MAVLHKCFVALVTPSHSSPATSYRRHGSRAETRYGVTASACLARLTVLEPLLPAYFLCLVSHYPSACFAHPARLLFLSGWVLPSIPMSLPSARYVQLDFYCPPGLRWLMSSWAQVRRDIRHEGLDRILFSEDHLRTHSKHLHKVLHEIRVIPVCLQCKEYLADDAHL